EVGLMPFRPFSRTHLGFIGDPLNLAARLMGEARSAEAVVSNTFYTWLAPERGRLFEEVEPIEAKNVGRIQGWRTTHRALASTPGARRTRPTPRHTSGWISTNGSRRSPRPAAAAD